VLKLTFACSLYDRMVPLFAGQVKPEGIDLTFLAEDDVRSTFDRMGKDQAFDLSEMSGTELITRLDAGGSPLVALPVWPSRVFRHGFVFVNRRAGIRNPKDLEGKRIGVPLYTMSAGLWARGMLQDDYGVDFSGVSWVQGGLDKPGTHGSPTLPPTIKVERLEKNTTDRSLWQLLVDGDLQALMTPTVPHGFGSDPDIVRLFENYSEVEADYYRRTRVFPIMHMIAVRRDRYEANPFIARSLYDAFEGSKRLALEGLREVGALRAALPLLPAYWEETRRIFGDDPWPYGIEANRPTLETLVAYLHREGLISRRIPVEELFVPGMP
jgi:4,5-dihydroxyphthalate decarboxylase